MGGFYISQYSKELKLSIIKRYLNGEESTISLVKEINKDAKVVHIQRTLKKQ